MTVLRFPSDSQHAAVCARGTSGDKGCDPEMAEPSTGTQNFEGAQSFVGVNTWHPILTFVEGNKKKGRNQHMGFTFSQSTRLR